MGRLRGGLIRLMVLALVAAGGGGAWLASEYVRPERVREALLATLRAKLPDVDVQVESAGLRLFGGISVQGLTLTRKGEAEPFFSAPSAVIAHDKESLARGVVRIRRVEIEGATVRLTRAADGRWNVEDLAPPAAGPDDELAPVPTVVVKNAVVIVTDRRADPLPPLILTDVRLSLLNDPATLLKFDSAFTLAPFVGGAAPAPGVGLRVPMSVSGKLNRVDRSVHARLEIPDLAMSPDLAPAFAKVHPALADALAQFHANLAIKADVKVERGAAPKVEARVDLRDGRFEDENLPWPLEHIAGVLQFKDNRLTVEKATARFGKAAVDLTLETRPLFEPPPPATPGGPPLTLPATITPGVPGADPLKRLEDRIERLQLTVRELPLDDDFFAKLPEKSHRMRRMFGPTGTIDVGVTMARSASGLKQEIEVRPNRAAMNYEKFRYPVQDLAGFVKRVSVPDGADEFRVQVTGTASGRRVELTGRVGSEGPDPLIDLTLTGIDFPIDAKLFAAMPAKYSDSLGKLQASGRGDFSVEIRQQQSVNRCESKVTVLVHEAAVHYEHFPYPLRAIRGRICIRIAAVSPDRPLRPGLPRAPTVDTDRVELRNFEAAHAGGKLKLDGDDEPIAGTPDRKLTLRVQGEKLPLDPDFQNAVAALKIGNLWQTLAPKGTFTFGADVEIVERGARPALAAGPPGAGPALVPASATAATLPGEPPFNPASDLKLTVNFKGPSVTPEFFPYELEDLAGVLRYTQGKVDLAWFTARHGATTLTLDAAEIRFGAGREVWANVGGLSARPFALDADVLKALPPKAREALRELKFRGPADLFVKHLVVKVPGQGLKDAPLPGAPPVPVVARGQASPGASGEPILYWNAELKMHGASVEAGALWEDLHGAVASEGKYEGDRLGAVLGHAWLDRATALKQPLTNLKVSYRVRPQRDDPARAGGLTPPVVEFPDLTANLYQGTLGGEAWVSLGEAPQFRLWLTAAGVRLDELAAHTKLAGSGELRGLAQGKILLENPPDAKSGLAVLTGVGQVDVPHGRMYNLPVLMPLLKLLKLQAPDQTAFEEAHAAFEVRGDRVRVTQLDLIGSALSLGGSGDTDLRGEEVRFEFYTVWSQALKRWLSTPFGDVTSFLSGNLFKIEMVKQPGRAMEYRPQMLPIVTEPVKNVMERLRNRLGPAPAEPAAAAPAAPPAVQRAAPPR